MSSNEFYQAYTDPTLVDPNETVYEHDVRSEWRPDKAPTIEDRFYRQVVPVQATASDTVSFQTYILRLGDPPALIVPRQPEGVACRVRIQGVSAGGSDLALLSDPSGMGVISQAILGSRYVAAGWVIPGNAPLLPPILWETKDAIYAVALSNGSGDPIVQVAIETFQTHI